jgi:Dyp-type peroxidase family
MVLIGADDPKGWTGHPGAARDTALSDFLAHVSSFGPGITALPAIKGDALFNREDGNGIEHFGYVDGRSQPLMLKEDLATEPAKNWDPEIPLGQVLLRDPGGALEVSCGSYFVFRKLEQDVKGFKVAEAALAETLGMKDPDDERAGASVVGRFENGTAVALSPSEIVLGQDKTVDNDFNYDNDPSGSKCPYAGHTRKTNPRQAGTKIRLMARRGIPFGTRDDDPNDGAIDNKPVGGVGLLFMAYQSDLVEQFEFTQRLWVNNAGFHPDGLQPVGTDPVIGQGAVSDGKQRYPTAWGVLPLSEPQTFGGFVTMRGGEYFFAPSLSFLKSLVH